jgi:hypothetical protein
MIDYEILLEISVVPGKIGMWVGIGTQPAVYVKCQPSQVNTIQKQLTRTYHIMASQGHSPTPESLRALAVRPMKAFGMSEAINSLSLIGS